MNNEFVQNDQQKVKMLNLYFSSQNQIDDTNKDLPYMYLEQAPHTLESFISLVKMLRTFYTTLMHLKPLDQILSAPPSQRRN